MAVSDTDIRDTRTTRGTRSQPNYEAEDHVDPEVDGELGEGEDRKRQPLEILNEYMQAVNIADLLDESELNRIGERVRREYDIDKASRHQWEEDIDKAMKLAKLQTTPKNYPWRGAANIKYPLLTSAAIQFAARAYPAIVPNRDVVKAKIIGKDDGGVKRKRGDRVQRHMSWQLLENMPEWEPDTDLLLHQLPVTGVVWRKTYFSGLDGRARSDMIHALNVVVHQNTKSLETCPRITEKMTLYPNEIEERMRSGIWLDVELGIPPEGGDDSEAPHEFLEQHRLLDLDGDGYAEPYVVTVHYQLSKVVKIETNFREEQITINADDGEIVRIERDHFFTKYGFIPDPDGGFHDIGFGYLLRPINEAVNSTINRLLDAGTLSNLQGGFIGSGARLRGGQSRFKPGEWQNVDTPGGKLKDNLVPLPVKEPSNVLFLLLGTMIDAGKEISSVKDVMTGGSESAGKNASPTTVLALIEQGMQVFSAIYKRIFRSLKSEYGKLYRLNHLYLDDEEYFNVEDEEEAIGREDYAVGDFDIVPMADPKMVTNMQRLVMAEFLQQYKDDPLFNPMEIRKRYLDAAGVDDIDTLLAKEIPQDPEVARQADELELKKMKLRLDEMDMRSQMAKRASEIIKNIADAEAAEAGPQLAIYTQEMGLLVKLADGLFGGQQAETGGARGNVDRGTVSGVEGPPIDASIPGIPAGAAGRPEGAVGNGGGAF